MCVDVCAPVCMPACPSGADKSKRGEKERRKRHAKTGRGGGEDGEKAKTKREGGDLEEERDKMKAGVRMEDVSHVVLLTAGLTYGAPIGSPKEVSPRGGQREYLGIWEVGFLL